VDGGVYADIYDGSFKGEKVAIKIVRPVSGLEPKKDQIRRVRYSPSACFDD
jgi:hypothetical protein